MNRAIPAIVSSSRKRPLVVILAVAMAIRLGVALWLPPQTVWGDGDRFNRIAAHITATGDYPSDERTSAPLHPVMLALAYSVTGTSGTAARVWTALLGVATCWVLFRLGRDLFDRTTGLVAAAMMALYPLHIYLSAIYEYPQALFIFLYSTTVLLALLLLERPYGWGLWALTGFVFGLAALTVPTVVTAVPLLAVWLLLTCRLRWAARAARLALLMLAFGGVTLVWSGYWYHLAGEFRLTSSGVGGEALYNGNCRLAWEIGKADVADLYEVEGCPPEHREAYAEYLEVKRAAMTVPAGPARQKVYYDAVRRSFYEHPGASLMLLARKALLYWLPYAQTVTRSSTNNAGIRIVQTVTFVPMVILAIWGTVIARDKWPTMTLLFLVVGSQWVTYSAFFPTARYRAHIDGFLVVLAAVAVVSWLKWLKARAVRANAPQSGSGYPPHVSE